LFGFGVDLYSVRNQRVTCKNRLFFSLNLNQTQLTAFELSLRGFTYDFLVAAINGFDGFNLGRWW